MKLINPSIEMITKLDGDAILRHLEIAIRNCYKSEDKICEGSANTLVKTILDSHHYSVIEHFNVTFRVICSRACMSQWTRHRHMSYSIESQRYICYAKDKFGGEIAFIKPIDFDTFTDIQKIAYMEGLQSTEDAYLKAIRYGLKAQQARGLLPNDVKTEMVVTANLRSLREFIKLRTSKSAQIEIRTLALDLLARLKTEIPVIFDDL